MPALVRSKFDLEQAKFVPPLSRRCHRQESRPCACLGRHNTRLGQTVAGPNH